MVLAKMKDDKIILRPAKDEDGDAIAEVIRWVFGQYPNCPFDRAAEFSELDAVATYLAGLGGIMWVAESDGRVVGCFGIVSTTAPGIFELYKVYLLPEARGRGIAGELLGMALDFARARGADAVRLWTDTRFLEGHIFYRRNGFEQLPITRYLADKGKSWEFAFRRSLTGYEVAENRTGTR